MTGKRRIATAGMACLLWICVFLPVRASQTPVISGFCAGDEISIFFEAGTESADERVQLIVEESKAGGLREAVRMAESGQTVHYFLLLDRSTSMPRYKSQVEEFVSTLMADTAGKKTVTLLSFGDAFHAELERAVDDDMVMKELQGIAYDEKKTKLYKGIWAALDYVELQDRKSGELFWVILVTDGIPYGEPEEPNLEQVTERVEASPEVFFTTLGLGAWPEESVQAFSIGWGIRVPEEGQDASGVGEEMAEEVNNLQTLRVQLSQAPAKDTLEVKLLFPASGRLLEQQGIPVLSGKGAGSSSGSGEADTPSQEGEGAPGEPNTPNQEGEGAPEEPDTPNREGEGAPEEPDTPNREGEGAPEEPDTPNQEGERAPVETVVPDSNEDGVMGTLTIKVPLWVFVLAGGILLGAGLGLALGKAGQSKRKGGKKNRRDPEAGGILIKLEVLSGNCVTKKREFYLKEELVIGSSGKCGLVWGEEGISEQNTRIFVHEGIVYIEDLNSACGTVLGGMRLYAPNRLRSGDIISIGEARFRFIF